MIDHIILDIVIIIVLLFQCLLLHVWSREQAMLLDIIKFNLVEIKKSLRLFKK